MGEGSAVTAGKGESRTLEWIWGNFAIFFSKAIIDDCWFFDIVQVKREFSQSKMHFYGQ